MSNLYVEVTLVRSDNHEDITRDSSGNEQLIGPKKIPVTMSKYVTRKKGERKNKDCFFICCFCINLFPRKVAVFEKLKITKTTQSLGTKFCLKFVLLQTNSECSFQKLEQFFVVSNPIEVFSHTCYLSPNLHGKQI